MAINDITPGPHEEQFWYNLQTGQVEQGGNDVASHLWGPFATREEAEQAMVKAKKRNEDWDNDGWNQ
ncbi:MAG: SPOR domain-containing protein [Rothia sp. (in: high G+C Gram-positive bacteria)]|nr:SPOR domain-containing protein [Rothia sp. (in: high G+C Gram-positive bacteria)]